MREIIYFSFTMMLLSLVLLTALAISIKLIEPNLEMGIIKESLNNESSKIEGDYITIPVKRMNNNVKSEPETVETLYGNDEERKPMMRGSINELSDTLDKIQTIIMIKNDDSDELKYDKIERLFKLLLREDMIMKEIDIMERRKKSLRIIIRNVEQSLDNLQLRLNKLKRSHNGELNWSDFSWGYSRDPMKITSSESTVFKRSDKNQYLINSTIHLINEILHNSSNSLLRF